MFIIILKMIIDKVILMDLEEEGIWRINAKTRKNR